MSVVWWWDLRECDGEGGGEEVGVEDGVTKRSEFAREWVREESSSGLVGIVWFSIWFCGGECALCPPSVPSVDCRKTMSFQCAVIQCK